MTGLPGVCMGCRESVTYAAGRWRVRTRNGKWPAHTCPPTRALCGAWMKIARERCVRRPGHTTPHRTQYAIDNARTMRTGRRAA